MQFWLWNKQATEEVDECDFASAALTALFDGEATAEEAAQARTHLITCARCAELWAGWNQTRYLFQQAPVMAPPRLLLRILMACRLASSKEAARSNSHERNRRGQGTVHSSYEGDLQPLTPPSSLHEEILRRTTRAATPAPVRELQRPVARATRGLGFGALQFNTRYAAATAVPAMLIIMSMVMSNPFDSSYVASQGDEVRSTLNAGIVAAPERAAEKGRRVLASVAHRVARLQPALASNNGVGTRRPAEEPRGDEAMASRAARERSEDERRIELRNTGPAAGESQAEPRDTAQGTPLRAETRLAAAREVPAPVAAAAPRMASHRVNPTAGGVQFASLSLPQSSRFEREVAALPPVANVTQTMTRIAPAAMMLVRRMASSRAAEPPTAASRTSGGRSSRPMRTRAALTAMPMPVTTQLAGFRSGGESFSSTRRSEVEAAADGGDGWSGDRDLRDNRPEAVKSVIENFRAALDQDDSDLTEG